MFLMFPHTSSKTEAKPLQINIKIYTPTSYLYPLQKKINITKQYNVPQQNNNKNKKKQKSHQNPPKTQKSTQKTPNKKQSPHKPNRAGVIQKITLKIRKFKNSKIIVHSSLNN